MRRVWVDGRSTAIRNSSPVFPKFELFNPGNCVSSPANEDHWVEHHSVIAVRLGQRGRNRIESRADCTSRDRRRPTLTPNQNALEDMFLDLFSGTRPSRSADVHQAGLSVSVHVQE